MSEETSDNSTSTPGDERHTDEPIPGMKELEQETSTSFVAGVRRKIHRKQTVSQFVSFSWQIPRTVFAELGNMLVHIVNTFSARKGE